MPPPEDKIPYPCVAVDFDGVLHSCVSGWTGPIPTDEPEVGAQRFIAELNQAGYNVVIMTTRAATLVGYYGVIDWMAKHGFPPVARVTSTKVPAVAYVDDRAVPYVPGSSDFVSALDSIALLKGRR